MIQLDKQTLRAVQMVQLELLVELRRICELENIHYNIIGGTLLGAVRHGGYIPWDDDADVVFLREEYECFRKACEKYLNHELYYMQDHRNTKGYRWGYGKLRKKGTLFLREHQEHMEYEQGIFIDLFPLDQVPDHKILRGFHNLHCYCIRKMLWSAVGKYAERKWTLRAWYTLLEKIPVEIVYEHMEHFIERSNKKPSKWVRTITFPTADNTYGYRRSWYENSKDYTFEGEVFQGILEYDKYLTLKYGAYMELPPESGRKTHPVSQLIV
ncbi:MAG: LicD family protein [Eubacteriales bacterium]